MQSIRPGRYRHFKGKEYQVLSLARHSGDAGAHGRLSGPLRGAGNLGASAAMWTEWVERDGYSGPRFTYLGEEALVLEPVSPVTRPLLWNLLQAYLAELSAYTPAPEPDPSGVYPYPYFDAYFTAQDRSALLLRVEGSPAGFALVNAVSALGSRSTTPWRNFMCCPPSGAGAGPDRPQSGCLPPARPLGDQVSPGQPCGPGPLDPLRRALRAHAPGAGSGADSLLYGLIPARKKSAQTANRLIASCRSSCYPIPTGGAVMANEDRKDFNAMLHRNAGMPKIQIITDEASIRKYGGSRMYFAPPLDYDRMMKTVPFGKLITVSQLRDYFARQGGADFTDPITAGIFVSIAAWASVQRTQDPTPWWRTLKAHGELNPKYPGGIAAQREKLEAEGHTILVRGRKHLRYYVQGYEQALHTL